MTETKSLHYWVTVLLRKQNRISRFRTKDLTRTGRSTSRPPSCYWNKIADCEACRLSVTPQKHWKTLPSLLGFRNGTSDTTLSSWSVEKEYVSKLTGDPFQEYHIKIKIRHFSSEGFILIRSSGDLKYSNGPGFGIGPQTPKEERLISSLKSGNMLSRRFLASTHKIYFSSSVWLWTLVDASELSWVTMIELQIVYLSLKTTNSPLIRWTTWESNIAQVVLLGFWILCGCASIDGFS